MPKNSKKRVVPPSRKELKQKHDEEVLTVGKFRLMFDGIFKNIKDLIQSTAKATQTALRRDMGRMETALMGEINGLKGEVSGMKIQISDLSLKMDKVVEKVDSHEERLSTVETRLDTHLVGHA